MRRSWAQTQPTQTAETTGTGPGFVTPEQAGEAHVEGAASRFTGEIPRTTQRRSYLPVQIAAFAVGALSFVDARAAGEQSLNGLDRYAEQARQDWQNVGMAVAVVQGTRVLYARGFGVRQAGRSEEVNRDTLFQVGSTSKAFTTAALGILVDAGKVHWDDPMIAHLPAFELKDPWLTRNVTVRDVVTHRTGIPDNLYPFFGIMTPDQSVLQLRYIPADGNFRDSFRYNNLMYEAAAKVIEAASGETWGEFVKERLFQPLKMMRSGTNVYDLWDARYVAPTYFGSAPGGVPDLLKAHDPNVAMPHGLDRNSAVTVLPWVSIDTTAAAGAVFSSAADMADWLIFQLNNGSFEGRQILKEATMEELHEPQNLTVGVGPFPLNDVKVSYAMGWFRTRYRGQTLLLHNGSMLGFPAAVAMLPEKKLGVVVLSNGPELAENLKFKLHYAIEFWVFDRLLKEPERDWRKELVASAEPLRQEARKNEEALRKARLQAAPTLPLEAYAGAYVDTHAPSGEVAVKLQNDQLILSFAGEGAFSGSLEHWHGDVFRVHSNAGGADVVGPEFVTFAIDEYGRVASLSMSSASFRFTLQRLNN